MSIELRMSKYRNGRKSRLYKKTKRASMNKIDAVHLPMRVQSDKGDYWSQTSRGLVHIPYSKIRKFLMARVGRPVDKVYSEFLQEGNKYAQIRNLQEVFNEFYINVITMLIVVLSLVDSMYLMVFSIIRHLRRG